MRVSKEKAAEHRQEILKAASRLFREQGISATGVDSITEDAGLTHGAVYSQFGSKEAIAVEAIRLALRDSKRSWLRTMEQKGGKTALAAIAESYLSRRHRDDPGRGCLVAALGSEIARQPDNVREAFTDEFKTAASFLEELIGSDAEATTSEDALAAFASMVGGIILARAVNDEALSETILKAVAKRIVAAGQVPAKEK